MPMGGVPGSQIEVTTTGDNLEDADDLIFSDPHLSATHKLDAAGAPEPNKYLVTIAADCPPGLYEARMMTRLGISTSRAFSVGTLPEVIRTAPNTSLATAMKLELNTLCNAVMSPRAVDYYTVEAKKGQRIVVECAARGIDSKLYPVVILANAAGNDLVAERQSGLLDFTAAEDGKYVIKIHELTYGGGPAFFYRLAVRELPAGAAVVRTPSTRPVHAFSWPPAGLSERAETAEIEPNNDRTCVQRISLPADISGSFFPAADVDVFEFEAKKGDVWWVEVASERLGLPTDPAVLVQGVTGSGDTEKLTDVAEFSDIPSPVKVSSNGYAYDGPPYQAGSSDVLGKLEIKDDGLYRLQLTDLFGGTRNERGNIYRLILRKAAPDFALVAWALHMELRNGDRNALSKPIALRGGATMPLEVVAVRRDGFDGEIELSMDGLPEGVTAQALKIPAGKTRGILLITARQDAPRALAAASLSGRAEIDGRTVTHPCPLASMAWPVPDSWSEIPSPRLLADVPVSVGGAELAPLTLAVRENQVWEVTAGEKLTIPLVLTRRSEFTGTTMSLKTFGNGFEAAAPIAVPLTADNADAVLDLAALKTPPGEYVVAFYGGAVAKYRQNPDAVATAEEAFHKAESQVKELGAQQSELKNAKADGPDAAARLDKLTADLKAATATQRACSERLKKATEAAKPRDLVDIVASQPITIRVKPAEKK